MTTAAANGVTWTKAARALSCEECDEEILPGETLVIFRDVHVAFCCNPGFTTRHYCADCGHLLEDSLTTSESLEMV
jgi:RNase P subunit RPR2